MILREQKQRGTGKSPGAQVHTRSILLLLGVSDVWQTRGLRRAGERERRVGPGFVGVQKGTGPGSVSPAAPGPAAAATPPGALGEAAGIWGAARGAAAGGRQDEAQRARSEPLRRAAALTEGARAGGFIYIFLGVGLSSLTARRNLIFLLIRW